MIFDLFIFIILLESMESVVIKTTYKMSTYEGNLKEKFIPTPVYSSFSAEVVRSCDHAGVVVGVSNNHMAGKTRYNVELLYFKNYGKIPKIPGDIEYFYPNLLTFSIPFAELEEISSEDLRYPRLKFLYLSHNKLTRLPGDLFRHTPHLEFIGLESNPIKSIGWYIFDNLNSLSTVYAGPKNVMCVDFGAKNRAEVLDIMKRFTAHCKSS